MKTAFYIGDHRKDKALTRAGAWITRLAQKGPYGDFTHVEAIHDEYADGSVKIASSSLRDGGVRSVRTILQPENWIIVDVPLWDVNASRELLVRTNGAKYDLRGAISTAFIGSQDSNCYFCSEWVAQPYLMAPGTFGPHHLGAVALSLGTDVTEFFFAERKRLEDSYNASVF